MCEQEFHAESFDEMVAKSKSDGMEMFQNGDDNHVKALNKMQEHIKSQFPEELKAWFDRKRDEFDALSENKAQVFYTFNPCQAGPK